MRLAGVGAVCAGGSGVDALKLYLQAPDAPKPMPMGNKELLPVLQVPTEVFKNPLLSPVRRADRFSKMTLLAALEAWQGAEPDLNRVGIIVASACGPHATVFKFVNDLLDFGESKSSPTVFSQSVHAAAASMIASTIQSHGPVINLADLDFPFESSLTLADAWLKEGRCDVVLVGATEELSDVYVHAISRLWGDRFVPGEGSFFFRLERDGKGPSVRVQNMILDKASYRLENRDALGVVNEDGALGSSLVSHSGSLRIGGAFLLAVAQLLRPGECLWNMQGIVTAGPVQIVSTCGQHQRVIVLEMKE
ncbi:MAG: beta-ketoacyl synthase chain length factor [bacterium]